MKIKSLKPVLSKVTLSVKNFKKANPQLFWVISICLVLSLIFTVVAIIKVSVLKNQKISNVSNNSHSKITDIPKIIPTYSNPDPSIKSFNSSKVTWLDKPQKISPLDIFISKTQAKEVKEEMRFDTTYSFYYTTYFNKASFYLIGNLSDGSQLIKVILPREEKSTYDGTHEYRDVYNIIKSPDNQVTITYPEENRKNSLKDIENKNKNFSNELFISYGSYSDLTPPESFYIDGMNFNKTYCYESSNLDRIPENFKFLSSNDYGDLYVIYENSNINGVFTRSFILKLKDWSYCSCSPNYDFVSDNRQVPQLRWSDGSPVSDQFTDDLIKSTGCGSNNTNYGPEIIRKDSSLLQNKVAIATYNGTTFFQIKNVTNPIVKYLYGEYESRFYSDPPELNIEEFTQAKNHFLYQDTTGDWVVFLNEQYGSMAECGKPVIYLYPQEETKVKVQVSAQITQSDPIYPENGWLVTAKPNGELTYQNQSYPYLFWEGLGNGIYPDYQDQGTLVTQKDLISTVYQQLTQLGLNQKESADFMEFWQPRLPKTPYVRLTWLNTQDMDKLAPLAVNPKPDTSIRIFLEFEGLEKPVTLKPQKLTAPSRNGFTLIEWGGLLIKPAK